MKTNWLRFISQNFTYVTYFRGKIAILKPRSAVTKNALICAVVEVLKPYTYLVQKASKSCFFELDLCSVARPCFFWCDDAHWVEKPFWKSIHIFHALGILWIFLLYSYCKAISVLKEHVYFVDSFNFLEQYTIFQNNNKISMCFKTEIPHGILPREKSYVHNEYRK